MNSISEQEFIRLSKKGNLVPIYKEVVADMETPVSAYYKLGAKAKYSFLLESVEGEEKIARFSFLARDPELLLESRGNSARIVQFGKKGKPTVKTFAVKENPLDFIRQIFHKYKFVNIPELPRFCGGMVGYLSYDIVRFFEKLPQKTKDDLRLPDMLMILAKNLVIFDHINHKIKVVSCVEIAPKASLKKLKELYKKAIIEINRTVNELNKPLVTKQNKDRRNKQTNVKLKLKSNFTKAKFESIVRRAKEEIQAGEIIQVVLSQRFEVELKTDPFEIYRQLRILNPSPYMYFLNFDKVKIIGSSPELLVRCENGIVETRPIAGTRPRGKTESEDKKNMEDLLADPKEKAEHIMLVDLGRNDLGRVCRQGTVHISELMIIEKYSHVMHIVSNVKGELSPDNDDLDVLQAAFPAGTVSGAPKIRAMEIIEKLEKVRRGPYAGCIGYLSFSGNLDTCITIRTIVATGNKAYVQAGAGIVADSDPEKEYEETLNKAKAQIKAIELAHK